MAIKIKQLPPIARALLDVNREPFVLVDKKFTIVACNEAYAKQFNVTKEDIVGRKCHEVSHKSERPCGEAGEDCPHLRMFASGKTEEALHVHTRHDGTTEFVEIKAHPIFGDDNELLYMGESLQPIDSEQALLSNKLIGSSPIFLAAISEAKTLANSELPVLLSGESGTGKEGFATYIHSRSPRANGALVTLDCCGLNEALFESELFGHEAGAYTDAKTTKTGLFESVDGGTLFLDEIGETSLINQAKLLRVIETGEFRRVGSTKTLRSDVRIISATNRNLEKMRAAGTFREDLYYRLAGHTVYGIDSATYEP